MVGQWSRSLHMSKMQPYTHEPPQSHPGCVMIAYCYKLDDEHKYLM